LPLHGPDGKPALATGREVCERLMERGVLAKDTHGSTIRLELYAAPTHP